MAKGKRKRKKRKKYKLTAKNADKHVLYQQTVQAPDFEVENASKFYRRRVGRKALSLREDFCGTALLCAKWVESDPERTAVGVDIDPSVLGWGREHNIEPLGDDAARVTLVEGDVRGGDDQTADVLMALNYSYFCFKDRDTLRGYFEAAKRHLNPDGLFFIDLFGGWESQQVLEEERKHKHYRYVWDQAAFNPITSEFLAHIHFRFRDGSELKRAFTYDWRLWTIPELRELLGEAGFGHVEVLWEDEDEDGDGTGTYRPRKRVENDPGFNAYLLASVDTPPQKKRKKKTRKNEE